MLNSAGNQTFDLIDIIKPIKPDKYIYLYIKIVQDELDKEVYEISSDESYSDEEQIE